MSYDPSGWPPPAGPWEPAPPAAPEPAEPPAAPGGAPAGPEPTWPAAVPEGAPEPDGAPPAPPPARPPRPPWLAPAVVGAVIGALVAGSVVAAVGRRTNRVVYSFGGRAQQTGAPAGGTTAVGMALNRVEPGVVAIFTSSFRQDELFNIVPTRGAGTGMVLTPDGDVLTNAHVVTDSTSLQVKFADGTTRPGRVVGASPSADVALVQVDVANGTRLPTVQIGDSAQLRVGDFVVAVGNALALKGGPTVTSGIISALDRSIDASNEHLDHLLQTDAAINPGNSGGPLVDSAGHVIGMNTAISAEAQNIGFAIASATFVPILDEIRHGQGAVPQQGFLGVGVTTITPDIEQRFNLASTKGVLVTSVFPGSAAEQAGIKPRDVVTALDGRDVSTNRQFQQVIEAKKPGETISVTFVRGGGPSRTVQATLGSRPTPTG